MLRLGHAARMSFLFALIEAPSYSNLMEQLLLLIENFIEIFRNLPEHLQMWATAYGPGFYAILAAIIFAETGLVVAPLLPGDSLLFAAGAVLALGLPELSLPLMCVILILAAFIGDLVNYHVGRWAAPRLFRNADGTAGNFESGEFTTSRVRGLNPKYLHKTRAFYNKHGGRTLVFARFVPIVRTYAPFVAGLTGMPLKRFMAYSFFGGTVWITLFLNLGYFFGNIPAVKRNFELVIFAIIFVSILPMLIEYVRARRHATS